MIRSLIVLCSFLIALASYVQASSLLLYAKGEKKIYRSFLKKEGLRFLSSYFLYVAISYIIYRALCYFAILKSEAAILVALIIGALYLLYKTPGIKIKELLKKGLVIDLLAVLGVTFLFSLAESEDLYLLALILPLFPFLFAGFTSFKKDETDLDAYPFPLSATTIIICDQDDNYLKESLYAIDVKTLYKSTEATSPYLCLTKEEFSKYQEVDFKCVIDMTASVQTKAMTYIYSEHDDEEKISFGYENSTLALKDLHYSFGKTTFVFDGENNFTFVRQRRLIALKSLLEKMDADNFDQVLAEKKGYLSVGDFEGKAYLDDSKANKISEDLLTFIRLNPHALIVMEAYKDNNEALNEVLDHIDHMIVIDNEYTKSLGQSLNSSGFDMEKFTLVKDLKEALYFFKSRQNEDSYLVLEHLK